MRVKNKKTFELSSITKYNQAERKLWIIPLACLIFTAISTGESAVAAMREYPGGMAVVGTGVWLCFGTILLAGIPYLIGKTRITIKRKIAIQNCTITSMQDFDYYRDKLTGLSPAIISILSDLEIEQEKDVAASILQYENLGLLVEDADHTYHVTEKYADCSELNESDRYLIEHLVAGDFDWEDDTRWKELVMKEAFSEGYLTKGVMQHRIVYGSKGRYFVKALLILGWICWFLSASFRNAELQTLFDMVPNTSIEEQVDFVLGQPKLLLGCAEMLGLFVLLMIAICYDPKTHKKMPSCNKKMLAVLFVYLGLVVLSLPAMLSFQQILDSDETNIVEQVVIWCSQPKGMINCFIVMAMFLFTMWMIAYVVVLLSPVGAELSKSFMNQTKRTAYGNQMAECVYGMKNFIHDYSNLSEADKRQVILWEDYLVYAVVLEENKDIVNEISKTRRNVL
ncbi:MAG: DUF2207 family protein [Roseburia sp.]